MERRAASPRQQVNEWRRLRAWALHQAGWRGAAIARALGVTEGAVSQWLKRARDQGPARQVDSRATGPAPGPARSRRRSVGLLGRRVDDQARRHADPARVWCHVSSRPCQSAAAADRLERPEAAPPSDPARRGGHCTVGDRALARPSSKAQSERRTIVWVDESGFYLIPAVVRTYAPRGQTPLLRAPLTRDHWSVIGGLTGDGRLLLQMQAQAYRGPAVVRFLQHLLRQIPGQLLVIWDGAPIHRAQVVKAFLAAGAAERLQLEPLPGYAPELNPAEGVWRYLKHVELRNVCCDDLPELRRELRLAVKRLRHKRRVLLGCLAQCGYGPARAPQADSSSAGKRRHHCTEWPDAA